MKTIAITALCVLVAGCATTDVQPLTQSSFKIATTAAPACGPSGARKVANKAASIEVIKRGHDRFIYANSAQDSFNSGGAYYGGIYGSYTSFQQGLVVQLVPRGDPRYHDALSARQMLGPEWQQIVAEGVSNTCT